MNKEVPLSSHSATRLLPVFHRNGACSLCCGTSFPPLAGC